MKKRYNDGGLPDYEREPSDEDKAQQSAAVDRYKADKENETKEKAIYDKPLAKASFKEAFAEARAAGDKTFEYMGKKYTTEMASEKPKAATKAEPKFSPSSALNIKTPATTRGKELLDTYVPPKKPEMSKEDRIKAASGGGKYVRGATPMKSGGKVSSASKRADGIAIRGKTRA
jgi:hypothetical protein